MAFPNRVEGALSAMSLLWLWSSTSSATSSTWVYEHILDICHIYCTFPPINIWSLHFCQMLTHPPYWQSPLSPHTPLPFFSNIFNNFSSINIFHAIVVVIVFFWGLDVSNTTHVLSKYRSSLSSRIKKNIQCFHSHQSTNWTFAENWPSENDFSVTDTIDVPTKRMYSIR